MVTQALNQSEKFVILDEGDNLVPKIYHQRQGDFVAFQMYNPKQRNFTR